MNTVIKEAKTLVNGFKHLTSEHRELTFTQLYVDNGFKNGDKELIILDHIIDKEDDSLLIRAFELAFSDINLRKIEINKNKLVDLTVVDMMKVYFTFMQENYYVRSEEEICTNTVNCLLELTKC